MTNAATSTGVALVQSFAARLARAGLVGAMTLAVAVPAIAIAGATGAGAQSLPQIRLGPNNRVPACVTPYRLMRFLQDSNANVPRRMQSIAEHYRQHGERLGVRWDYAFFQMIVETNALKFRNNAGRGDVDSGQNNFAGIGTTGGGVPGDRFPDVSTGVLAQMQHLIAYSGELVERPVARRTREKQDDIISRSRRLRRPVTFRDLAGRWAADRRYASTIASVADRYRRGYCTGRSIPGEAEAARDAMRERAMGVGSRPRDRTDTRADVAPVERVSFAEAVAIAMPPAGLIGRPSRAVRPSTCKVFTASYGGQKNVLIRRYVGAETHYTALQVMDGREERLAESFIKVHARGGQAIAEYPSRAAALERAFSFCPDGGGKS